MQPRQLLFSIFILCLIASFAASDFSLCIAQDPKPDSGRTRENEIHPELPGWPKDVQAMYSPVVADLDGDGMLELVVRDAAGISAYHHDGSQVDGWPWAPGTPPPGRARIGNVDDDPELEVVLSDERYVWVFTFDGQSEKGWPKGNYFEMTGNSVELADLDGDGDLEVITMHGDLASAKFHAWNGDGSSVDGWPVDLTVDVDAQSVYFGWYAAGDIDFDGKAEVIASTYAYEGNDFSIGAPWFVLQNDGKVRDGFPYEFNCCAALFHPMIVDLDGDHFAEIVGPTIDADLFFTIAPGSFTNPVPNSDVLRPFAAADFDHDNVLEVVVPRETLRIYDMRPATKGDILAEAYGPGTYSTFDGVSIGDTNGDGNQEILVWSMYRWNDEGVPIQQYSLHLFDHQLNEATGWPIEFEPYEGSIGIIGSTILSDLDNDGDMEAVYSFDGIIHVLTFEKSGKVDCKAEWPMLGHDSTFSFNYHSLDPAGHMLIRGDTNQDDQVNLSDAVFQLRYLFLGGETQCHAAFDVNADSKLELSDAVRLLRFLFNSGEAPAAPYPNCGPKPVGETLKCMRFECP